MTDPKFPPMIKPSGYRARWPWIAAGVVVAILIINFIFGFWPFSRSAAPPPSPAALGTRSVSLAPPESPVIDYGKIEQKSDKPLNELIVERKEKFGLSDSVDMVVSMDESIRVGDETVPLREILAEIDLQREALGEEPPAPPESLSPAESPEIVEENLTAKPTIGTTISRKVNTPDSKPVTYYGVYVVRPGDNLWDIHFTFLRDYFNHRNVRISPMADEGRDGQGRSTGVARVLKYAETMVHIFNMKTRQLDQNLDMLEPQEKVVIFNLTNLHRILGSIPDGDLDSVRFLGRDLIVPVGRTVQDSTLSSPDAMPSAPAGN